MLNGWLKRLTERRVTLEDRRTQHRAECRFNGTCRLGNHEVAATVLDIHHDGLRVALPIVVEPGRVVKLSARVTGRLLGRQRLACRVAWSRALPEGGAEAGLVYADSAENLQLSWVQHALRSLRYQKRDSYRRRRWLRVGLSLPVEVEYRSTYVLARCEGHTLNLGVGGACLKLEHSFQAGDIITVQVDRTSICGRVLEERQGVHRIRFFNIDRQAVASLKETLQEAAREATTTAAAA